MDALRKLRLSPWLIVLAAVSLLLQESAYLWLGLACVVLHEGGHALCARLFGVAIDEIELAPFGGVVYLRGLEQLPVGKTVCVALAGPGVNLLLALACGCLAYLVPEKMEVCSRLLAINVALMLFNLLPAFPMDGGRVLCALLRTGAGLQRAQRIAAGCGMAVGLMLVTLGVVALHYTGKINLTLIIGGGYVLFAAGREMRATAFSYLQTMAGRGEELRRRRLLPVRTIAVREGTTDAEIYAQLLPGAMYRIVYVDENMRVVRSAWESELMGGIYRKKGSHKMN